MKKGLQALFVFIIMVALSGQALAVSKELFEITRNVNANVVRYDVVLNADGTINDKTPIDAYWILRATDGSREELGMFQKKAYGYNITKNGQGQYVLTLKPSQVKDKPVTIVLVNGAPKGIVNISGREAYLKSVFVQASGIASVDYILLTGNDVKTGQEVQEKISGK
jgi:hypothetical protein